MTISIFGILEVSFNDKQSNDREIENYWILVSSKFHVSDMETISSIQIARKKEYDSFDDERNFLFPLSRVWRFFFSLHRIDVSRDYQALTNKIPSISPPTDHYKERASIKSREERAVKSMLQESKFLKKRKKKKENDREEGTVE